MRFRWLMIHDDSIMLRHYWCLLSGCRRIDLYFDMPFISAIAFSLMHCTLAFSHLHYFTHAASWCRPWYAAFHFADISMMPLRLCRFHKAYDITLDYWWSHAIIDISLRHYITISPYYWYWLRHFIDYYCQMIFPPIFSYDIIDADYLLFIFHLYFWAWFISFISFHMMPFHYIYFHFLFLTISHIIIFRHYWLLYRQPLIFSFLHIFIWYDYIRCHFRYAFAIYWWLRQLPMPIRYFISSLAPLLMHWM